jgi:hypothetical protein
MLKRKPVTINGRTFVYPEFRAALSSYPKAKEEPSVVTHKRPARQTAEGFGGGRVVGK